MLTNDLARADVRAKAPRRRPICSDCRIPTTLAPHDDEPGASVWRCTACGAWASCQPGTLLPGSEPAGAETRELRDIAYKARRDAHQRLRDHGASWSIADRRILEATRKAVGKWKNIGFSDAAQARALAAAYAQI